MHLHDDLEIIRKLNDLRDRAKDLRQQGLRPLKGIKEIDTTPAQKKPPIIKTKSDFENKDFFNSWFSSGNEVEVSLLMKIQNHPDISLSEKENNEAEATDELKDRLQNLKMKDFFPKVDEVPGSRIDAQPTVSVLMAARIMQTLVRRADSVFSKNTMLCYYRIVRELYFAGASDYTFGAARAGYGAGTSAFVTGECIRAIFAFEDAIKRTIRFLENTQQLYDRFNQLEYMLKMFGIEPNSNHPLSKWADLTIERMWLDCHIATNPRGGQIALFYNQKLSDAKNQLLLPEIYPVNLKNVGKYFDDFKNFIKAAVNNSNKEIRKAKRAIEKHRNDEKPVDTNEIPIKPSPIKQSPIKQSPIKQSPIKLSKDDFDRTESSHLIAFKMIENALSEAMESKKIIENSKVNLDMVFEKFISQGEDISRRIHRVVEPTKQYIKNVIRRELLVSKSEFDAGELVFAATAFGSMTNWKSNELLTKSCDLLKEALPMNGRLMTKRPLHSTQRGYRLLPIGCEMTRCLAQLFQKTNYDVDPIVVGRMLNIFEEKPIPVSNKKGNEMVGWNFDGSPNPNKPCVWVTAVAVLALDRIVRMLNSCINRTVYKHFDVFYPEKPHVELTLNDLIYSDAGFREYFYEQFLNENENYKDLKSIPIDLELMKAHVMRAKLPTEYLASKNCKTPIFSAIFYGPPSTGKTTLAEALGLSSNVPVVSLSPNDLLVEGHELMEGRVRDVFESLSMLTQTVIIFDEFEPILASRSGEMKKVTNLPKVIPTDFTGLETSLREVAREIEEISKKDDPKFQFLLGGMLPRLLKLHDVAKKQSLVYCLATNYLKKIDHAAKRTGRFDLKIPVYNPDPLSRAGTLLFRLSRIKKSDSKLTTEDWNKVEYIQRFKEILVHTTNESASELSGRYFKIKAEGGKIISDSEFLNYIIFKTPVGKLDVNKSENMKNWLNVDNSKIENFEKNERDWLEKFEVFLKNNFEKKDLAKILKIKPYKKK